MLTLVLTNRNRDLRIVNNCLNSLKNQTNQAFNCILVDYGSDDIYVEQLKNLLAEHTEITFVSCKVSGQLWSKCRAINIALKASKTPYFMVGDIDLLFHPEFVNKAIALAKPEEVHYFQYGFLSKEESLLNKSFKDYQIDFKGNHEVTGTTMFPSEKLKALNGYDEFYHGWGAEDTDIHIRMKNAGLNVFFYDDEVLLKHQWHPKAYRRKSSIHPFHSQLERINHAYMNVTKASKRIIVNQDLEWGKLPNLNDYEKLKTPDISFSIKASNLELKAFLGQLHNFKNEVVKVQIIDFSSTEKQKNSLKKFLSKKNIPMLDMETVNNIVLETIITKFRNNAYQYQFNRNTNTIVLTMSCKS